jgi:threonylcarbamoyladenosine tRNA methylthiotransferase MtaB
MKVLLSSIGCRLNQSEIETMSRQLLAQGNELVTDTETADKIIINTCAVTSQAARDARTQTRRIQRQNPKTEIFLTGCYATVAPHELQQLEGSLHVIPNKDKHRLVRMLDPQTTGDLPVYDHEPVMREYLRGQTGNTRAFVKAQDGCNNRCTFCITTIARGPGRSRPVANIVSEIQAMATAGYKEIVLTGVHLGSYGRDFKTSADLRQLVKTILHHTDIPRLRLSSLEPWDLAPEFFTLWQNPRLLPHLHMPLQSGSDRILRLMARRTSRRDFRRLAASARAHIPDLNLSTDMILGFPGESRYDFEQSLDFVREIGFSRLHAFTYSPRPGTAAAGMPMQIPHATKKERTRQMIELGKQLSLAYHQRFFGQTRPVLWETNIGANKENLLWSGYSDNYIRITAAGPVNLYNSVTPTRLLEVQPGGATGTIVWSSA